MNARADRFPLFDSLRAIAALSVFAAHAYLILEGFGSPNPLRDVLVRLDVGVTIFFVISGFLLYRPFVRARLRSAPPPRPLAYAWRRLLRIAPAYWVALTIIAVWLGLGEVHEAGKWPLFYFF